MIAVGFEKYRSQDKTEQDTIKHPDYPGMPSGCRLVLKDGAYHHVDSSELAFRLVIIGMFRQTYKLTCPVILESIMTVEVVVPIEFQSQPLPFEAVIRNILIGFLQALLLEA